MTPELFLRGTTVVFLSALAMTVAYMILVRKINLHGLLHGQNKNFSPGRVQALVATLIAGGGYLMILSTHNDPSLLPPIPIEFLAVFGGSHSLYLAEKLITKL